MQTRNVEQKARFGRRLLICALVVSVWVIAACNTTKGVGKDIEAAGEGIQNAAD